MKNKRKSVGKHYKSKALSDPLLYNSAFFFLNRALSFLCPVTKYILPRSSQTTSYSQPRTVHDKLKQTDKTMGH